MQDPHPRPWHPWHEPWQEPWEDMGLVLHYSWKTRRLSLVEHSCFANLLQEDYLEGEEEAHSMEYDENWEAIHYDWVWVHT